MTDLQQAQFQGLAPWKDHFADLGGVQIFRDAYPVTPGHLLFVPDHNDAEHIVQAFRLAQIKGRDMIDKGECDGFNVGINWGRSAGQTVMYPHVHLIPRRTGDTGDPTGGVRGVISDQQNYKKPGYKNPTDK